MVQSGPLHGTNPAALIKTGIKNIDNKHDDAIKKNIFFIFCFGALARTRTRNDWFEASNDIQFHHEGIINYRASY